MKRRKTEIPTICYVLPDLKAAGTQWFVIRLATLLKATAGARPIIVSLARGGALEEVVRKQGIRYYHLGAAKGANGIRTLGWARPSWIARLSNLYRSEQVHIVHTNLLPASIPGRIAAWIARVPIVVDAMHNVYPWKDRDAVALYIDRLLASRTTRLVACSDTVRIASARQLRVPLEQVITIYHGIDTETYCPGSANWRLRAQFGLSSNHFVLGCVARLKPAKRVRDLIEVMPRILTIQPKAKALIIGDGDGRPELELLVRNMGLGRAVVFAGEQQSVSADLYRIMDVFVQLAEREGFGLAWAEAAATGIPVIAAANPTLLELLDTQRAMLMDVGDKSRLIAHISTILKHRQNLRSMIQRGRNSVVNQFSYARMLVTYERFYRDLLSEVGPDTSYPHAESKNGGVTEFAVGFDCRGYRFGDE